MLIVRIVVAWEAAAAVHTAAAMSLIATGAPVGVSAAQPMRAGHRPTRWAGKSAGRLAGKLS